MDLMSVTKNGFWNAKVEKAKGFCRLALGHLWQGSQFVFSRISTNRVTRTHHFTAVPARNPLFGQKWTLCGTCAAKLAILYKQQAHAHQRKKQGKNAESD